MITTRRSETNSISAFGSDSSKAGIALLERREPVTYKEYIAPDTTGESPEEARVRMQENLAKLLNYDRYSEQVQDVAPVAETVEAVETIETEAFTAETIQDVSAVYEDDIRPTSTTMQFGDGDIENLRMDMKQEEQTTGRYKLNGKGKLVLILYSLVLTVVMALIVINTGVLAKLSATEQSLMSVQQEKVQALSSLETEFKDFSSIENISKIAEQELGMVK